MNWSSQVEWTSILRTNFNLSSFGNYKNESKFHENREVHMRYGSSITLTILFAGSLAGCGNLNTAFRTYETENLRLISIDAKQRVITVSKGSDKDRSEVTCAEPSPDALSAASASGSGSLEIASKALGLGYSASEGAAYIGLRTQTIQLLRDAMYRLCEGYAAGALTKDRYHRLQRHYQNSMVVLLAIEQLTSAVIARPAAISTSGGVERGKLLQQAKESVDAATAALEVAAKAKLSAPSFQ